MKNINIYIFFLTIFFVSSCEKNSIQNCSTPSIEIHKHSAGLISITSSLDYDLYEMQYGKSGFSLGDGTKKNGLSVSGLSTGDYDFYIRGYCGGTSWSEWSEVKSTHVDNGDNGGSSNCKTPNNLSNSDGFGQLEGVMSIHWDDKNYPNNAGYFELEYGPSGFNIGDGEKATINNSNYSDGAFLENTTYDVYVRANCGGSEFSSYSDVYSFHASENYNACLPPKNVIVTRNGSNINFSFIPNGEIEYEYTMVYTGDPVTSGTLSSLNTSLYASSGGWTGVSSYSRTFFIRAKCRDGSRSDWSIVTVP